MCVHQVCAMCYKYVKEICHVFYYYITQCTTGPVYRYSVGHGTCRIDTTVMLCLHHYHQTTAYTTVF